MQNKMHNNSVQTLAAWRRRIERAAPKRGGLSEQALRGSANSRKNLKLTSVLFVFDILLPLEMLSIVFLKTWRLCMLLELTVRFKARLPGAAGGLPPQIRAGRSKEARPQ